MLVRPLQLSISEASPFASDKLDRDESAHRLTHLLERVQPPFVLGIDAKYGNGKTTFIQMWKAHLKTKGFRSLYFNAWESDFASDPLIAFIGEMDAEINQFLSGPESSTKLQASWNKVKDVGAYLAKKAVPLGVKIATANYLDLEKFTEQSIANLAENIAKEQIEKYEGTKNKIKEFRKLLGEFIKSLTPQDRNVSLPLVFFVDELDRCRPPYAIELLERVKHFFGIEEIVFVLAMDKAQLSSSIRAIYGNGIDVNGYLRRFIDLEYCLPVQAAERFVGSLADQFGLVELMRRSGVQDAQRKSDIGITMFSGLAETFDLSLRVQEQCFGTLAVICLTANLSTIHFPLLVALLALKAADEKLYNDFLLHKANVNDILSYIKGTRRGQVFMEESEGVILETALLTSRSEDEATLKIVDRYKQMVSTVKQKDMPNAEAHRASIILSRINNNMGDIVGPAAKSIAFASQFQAT